VRQLIELTFPPLVALRKRFEDSQVPNAHFAVQNALFAAMADKGDLFGGNLAGAGSTFLAMDGKLQGNVLSTARAELKFLASLTLQAQAQQSDFRLEELAGDTPTTIYLCMSPSDLEEQFRWLRLIVRQALSVLERRGSWPEGKPRVVFLMEEFPVLRHMPVMEQAAAYFPGFGVKLWCVVQDLSQLKRYYKSSWTTFLGNAGVLQFFANADKDTLDYISERGGSLSFVRGRIGAIDPGNEKGARDYMDKERLLYGHEAARIFAKENWAQCLFVAGEHPMAISRLTHEQVAHLRAKIMRDVVVEGWSGRIG
jgi:type IV secretion system protein VirD4